MLFFYLLELVSSIPASLVFSQAKTREHRMHVLVTIPWELHIRLPLMNISMPPPFAPSFFFMFYIILPNSYIVNRFSKIIFISNKVQWIDLSTRQR